MNQRKEVSCAIWINRKHDWLVHGLGETKHEKRKVMGMSVKREENNRLIRRLYKGRQ